MAASRHGDIEPSPKRQRQATPIKLSLLWLSAFATSRHITWPAADWPQFPLWLSVSLQHVLDHLATIAHSGGELNSLGMVKKAATKD
jgi:hypothetical protein